MDRGLETSSKLSSNLCADFYSDSLSCHRFVVVSAFPSLPFLHLHVNSFVFTLLSSRSSSLIAVATRRVKSQRTDEVGFCEIATAQNLKDQPAFRPSQYWLAEITLRVLQWDVLCGIPYRGRGALASPHPTNRLLSSLSGQLPNLTWAAFRSSTAHKQLFESITARSQMQAP